MVLIPELKCIAIHILHLLLFFVLQMTCTAENLGWMNLIPDADLLSILKAQTTPQRPVNNAALQFFQGNIKGCVSSKFPACTFVTAAQNLDRWKQNELASKISVPFDISDSISDDLRIQLLDAIEVFETLTCLLFTEKSSGSQKYISFISGNSCAADWGGTKKLELQISVNKECVATKTGSILQLIMHALGFPKEHSRNDRDKHIIIYWDNIIDDHKSADFRKDDESVKYDDPYDYESVTHPDYLFLAKAFTPTITGTTQISIGQRKTLSQYDILKVNRQICGARIAPTPSKRQTKAPCGITTTTEYTKFEVTLVPETVLSTAFVTVSAAQTVTQTVTETSTTSVPVTLTQTVTQCESRKDDIKKITPWPFNFNQPVSPSISEFFSAQPLNWNPLFPVPSISWSPMTKMTSLFK